MYTSTNKPKEGTMRATFIRRRIAVAVAAAFFSWGAVNTGQAIVSFLNEPTFTCKSGTHTWTKGDKMWNIADVHCDGNITDATKQIMNDNGIEGKDLNTLRVGTIIVIKGGN